MENFKKRSNELSLKYEALASEISDFCCLFFLTYFDENPEAKIYIKRYAANAFEVFRTDVEFVKQAAKEHLNFVMVNDNNSKAKDEKIQQLNAFIVRYDGARPSDVTILPCCERELFEEVLGHFLNTDMFEGLAGAQYGKDNIKALFNYFESDYEGIKAQYESDKLKKSHSIQAKWKSKSL